MDYVDHVNEHVRAGILRLLSKQAGYRANDSILRDALERVGLTVSRDALRVQLDWLSEQGLATIERLEHLVVATATGRGVDVAEGRAFVTGVKRPSPR